MKFYETHFDEYLTAVENNNFHPTTTTWLSQFPPTVKELPHLIFYGPAGVGKYSHTLHFLRRYSPSQLKHEKKMELQTEKHHYNYKMSDIHFEIDMSTLGCNSKCLWHDLFAQIVDIVSANNFYCPTTADKIGILVCKNFHTIHSELLEIFYNYMQHYRNNIMSSISFRFLLITESVSFLPNNILQASQIISFGRPSLEQYQTLTTNHALLSTIETKNITNMKEIKSMQYIKTSRDIPEDLFDNVCYPIIREIQKACETNVLDDDFRTKLYNILTYNLDVVECIWFIVSHFLRENKMSPIHVSEFMDTMNVFLKQYNNNYRPIYHLENIFYAFLLKLRADLPPKSNKPIYNGSSSSSSLSLSNAQNA
jgi:hypothetical protein